MQAKHEAANFQIESSTMRLRTAEAAQIKSTCELETVLNEERDSAVRQKIESQRLHLKLQSEEAALQAERTSRKNMLDAPILVKFDPGHSESERTVRSVCCRLSQSLTHYEPERTVRGVCCCSHRTVGYSGSECTVRSFSSHST